MESLPFLIPLWQDAEMKDLFPNKNYAGLEANFFPDYGGAGIDVYCDNNEIICHELKYRTVQENFVANKCSLPFLPPNKVKCGDESCLKAILKQKHQIEKYSSKLASLRKLLNENKSKEDKEHFLSVYKEFRKRKKYRKISLPQRVIKLARKLPEKLYYPVADFSYLGGCLSKDKIIDRNVLLHPWGKKLNKIAITYLNEVQDDENFKVFQSDSIQVLNKLKGGKILQINSLSNGFCFIRQKNRYHVLNLRNINNENSAEVVAKSYKTEHDVSYISPNPFLPHEFLVTYRNGRIVLKNIEKLGFQWKSKKRSNDSKHGPWMGDFGSHSYSVLYLDTQFVNSLDLRWKPNKFVKLFSIKDSPHCIKDEQLTFMKHLRVHPYQYLVASNFHLFVCDERYPQKPVLLWDHMLSGYPIYCDFATYNSSSDSNEIVILLADQLTRDISSHLLKSSSTRLQPFSLSPPLHLSTPTDCSETLKYHGILIDDYVKERLSYPLVGLSAISHTNQHGFTAFQVSSVGDVFFQDFRKTDIDVEEKTYRVEIGCVLSPLEKIQAPFEEWAKNVPAKKKRKYKTKNLKTFPNMKPQEFLINSEANAENCALCKDIYKITIDTDLCPSCGLDTTFSQELEDTSQNLAVLAGNIPEPSALDEQENKEELKCDAFEYSKYTDPLSIKLLDVWLNENEDPASPATDWDFDSLDINSTSDRFTSIGSPSSFSDISQISRANSMTQETKKMPLSSSQESENNFVKNDDYIEPSQDINSYSSLSLMLSHSSKLRSNVKKSTAGF